MLWCKAMRKRCGQVLPDLTDGKWESRGERQVPDGLHKDTLSDTFQWAIDEDRGYGLVKANYTFYVSKVPPACAAFSKPRPEPSVPASGRLWWALRLPVGEQHGKPG